MDKNVLDIATDILKTDLNDIKTFIHNDLKGTRPYRKVAVSTADKIANYLATFDSPEKKQMAIQQFGDPAIKYINDMESKIGGYLK